MSRTLLEVFRDDPGLSSERAAFDHWIGETMNITSKTRRDAITSALRADGYAALVGREEEIRTAALSGSLLWTRERLTTTDRSRIDERPKLHGHEGQRTER